MVTRRSRRPHKPIDGLAKQVVNANPATLLGWLSGLGELRPVRSLDTNFITTLRTTDTLWEVVLPDGERVVVLLEIELRPNADTPLRVHVYASNAEGVTKLRVLAIVLCLTPPPGGAMVQSTFGWSLRQWTLQRTFQVINLWEIDVAEAFKPGLEGLLPFVPFMRGGNDEMTVSQAFARLQERSWSPDIELLMLYLVQRQWGPEGVARLGRRLNMQVLKGAPWYADILEEGRQEGRAEAQRAERSRFLLQICERRFGPLTASQKRWLADLTDDELLAAIDLALGAESIDVLQTTLRPGPAPKA